MWIEIKDVRIRKTIVAVCSTLYLKIFFIERKDCHEAYRNE